MPTWLGKCFAGLEELDLSNNRVSRLPRRLRLRQLCSAVPHADVGDPALHAHAQAQLPP